MIIYGKEKEILKAQKRSLAAWINNTIGATVVDADNLTSKLSTGVILCKLAKCIQKAVEDTNPNTSKNERQVPVKYWERAKRETFFARDNAEIFIRWCKYFGVRDAVLFESDGLVLQTQPRTVILCLLELARLASKYGILLPPPIQLSSNAITIENASDCSEDEIFYAATIPSPPLVAGKSARWDSGCSSEARSPSASSNYSKTPSPCPTFKKKDKSVVVVVKSKSENYLSKESSKKPSPRISPKRSASLVRTDTISSRIRSNSTLSRSNSSIASSKSFLDKSSNKKFDSLSQSKRSSLDKRVTEIARKHVKDENTVHRLSEGHYLFGDKSVFLRIVRGNNVVVRIGGGWDTLDHYLESLNSTKKCTKNNPPQRKILKQKTSCASL